MGTKRKFWCRTDGGLRYLFKYARDGTGEDWSEKIAAEVAAALGVPHADVDLAVCGGQPGSLTLDFAGDVHALIHGNELLQEQRPGYPVDAAYRASEHTVAVVLDALSQSFIHPPAVAASARIVTAVDWFIGYLLLDAMIGNTDRHHENWAVLESIDQQDRRATLAPSYDHASSLGRELTDDERRARLDGKDERRTVTAYARKTRSALYRSALDNKPMSPADAFAEALERSRTAGRRWLERLEQVEDATLSGIVARVPSTRMSEPARRFAIALMATNRRSLMSRIELQP